MDSLDKVISKVMSDFNYIKVGMKRNIDNRQFNEQHGLEWFRDDTDDPSDSEVDLYVRIYKLFNELCAQAGEDPDRLGEVFEGFKLAYVLLDQMIDDGEPEELRMG